MVFAIIEILLENIVNYYLEVVMSKKTLSAEQIEDAERLKAIFNEKKKEAKQKGKRISQETIADTMGMTQGAVGHFLNARSPLNLSNAIKFAEVLGVTVADFSPSLAKQLISVSAKPLDSIPISEQSINNDEPEIELAIEALKKFLNRNESFLIEKFRSLSTEHQHALISIISGINDTDKNNKTINNSVVNSPHSKNEFNNSIG